MLATRVIFASSSALSFIWRKKRFHFGCFNSGVLPGAGNNHHQPLSHQISNVFSLFLHFSAVCPSCFLPALFWFSYLIGWLTRDLFVCVFGMIPGRFDI